MRSQSKTARLRVEPLEDRTLMSTCHVTRLSDTGTGKGFRGDLRYCINKVNDVPGPDAIDFKVTGIINLTGVLPNISEDLAIVGPGADDLSVRRDTGGAYRIFTVDSGVNAEFYSITIENGLFGTGGGIRNEGSLILADVIVTSNTSTGTYWSGGGIYNGGSLLAFNTVISGNTSNAIGGGVLSTGTVNFVGCTISDNLAGGHGGGIGNVGTMTVQSSTISGNSAADGGGLSTGGTMLIQDTTISDNDATNSGGGITLGGHSVGLTIKNSTVSGNTAGNFGGGIFNAGFATLAILNSTISDNSAEKGGGVHASGVGCYNFYRNSIFAGNWADTFPDFKGSLNSSGHNLFGSSIGGTNQAATDLLDVDPMLGPLANNGGPTLTYALLPGSPAIDAGDNADAPDFDQRGPGFPRIVNGTIDIGAFEVQATGAPRQPRFLAFLITASTNSDE